MTLKEAKQQVAIDAEGVGYKNFNRLLSKYEPEQVISMMDKAAELYASSKLNVLGLNACNQLRKCQLTIDKIGEIFECLKKADHQDLPKLLDAVDIDFKLISATIKDEINKINL